MTVVAVGPLADLVEGAPKIVEAAGRQILVVLWRGEIYAVRNICPHQSGSLECSFVRPSLVARPAAAEGSQPSWDLAVSEEAPVVQCPWHRWDFRVTDGQCASDPRFRVRAYETRVENGEVYIDTSSKRGRPRTAEEVTA